MQPELVTPSIVWVRLFVLACSALFLGCLYHAIKVGILEFNESRKRGDPRLGQLTAASTQVVFLVVFVCAYWLLESLAHTWTPYFVYAPEFPDGVRLGSFGTESFPDRFRPQSLGCTDYVQELVREDSAYQKIPLSVLLMESSLTYAAMWTALKLHAGYRLVPLWAALFVVSLDALLDPVVAVTYDCSGVVRSGGSGLGFWHWFLDNERLGNWFGVPLFNYAAWWTAPVILISLAMFVQYFRGRFWRERRNRRRPGRLQIVDSAPTSPLFGLTGGILLAAYVLFQITRAETAIWLQWMVLALGVLSTAAFVVSRVRSFRTRAAPDPNLTLPPLVLLGLPALALLIEGFFLDITGLILVGLVSVTLVVMFTLWPYQETVCRFARSVIDLDRFIRLAYYGFSSLLVLLGAFSVALEQTAGELKFEIENWQIGGLLVVALAFQIFAYVSNDVIDLDIDQGQRKRGLDPLARGAISRQVALAISFVQIPAALLVAFLIGAGLRAYAVLLGGFALMTVYNVFGKWCRAPSGWRRRLFSRSAPPLTDVSQALAWGSLVLFGALIVDPTRASDNWILVYTIFAFAAGFILLVNGIHGGLRDLENDIEHGCETTASWLGASVREEDGAVLSNWKVRAYAYTVHTAMWILPLWVLVTARGPGDEGPLGIEMAVWQQWAVGVTLALCFLGSHTLLRRVVRDDEPERDRYISGQPLIMMQTPLLSFVPFLYGMTPLFILFVCFYGPLLATQKVVAFILRFTHPEIASIACTEPGEESERPVQDESRRATTAAL